MRGYIFTRLEQKILNNYVRNGKKVMHFNVLVSQIRRNDKYIEEDLKLLEKCKRKNKAIFTSRKSSSKNKKRVRRNGSRKRR